MEHIDLTLNKNKSISSINQIQNLNLDLEREEKLLPVDSLQGKIDAYEQYLKEKDACTKYRFVFTIRPYCTNILCNYITEAVYKEGTDDCRMFTKERDAVKFFQSILSTGDKPTTYAEYKYRKIYDDDAYISSYTDWGMEPITRDTGYSSKTNGDKVLDYHCGMDIFNNHLLRRKEFVCVNPFDSANTSSTTKTGDFNTLFDELRDPFGSRILLNQCIICITRIMYMILKVLLTII